MAKGSEIKKMVFGSVGAIAAATIVFSGISQTVKALEMSKTKAVPTSYSIPYTKPFNSNIPTDDVKKDYKIKFVGQDQPTVNDMKMEEAAELVSKNLWRIFQVDLKGKTLDMTYYPISTTRLRPKWDVSVKINDLLAYHYTLDAVTGENLSTEKSVYHDADIREEMDINPNLLKNSQEYQELAKATAEKYQFVSGKVTSAEYEGQVYQANILGAQNVTIIFRVKSDKGEVARLTFSRYNQELLSVEFNSWIEEFELKVNEE
ncbi:hypothetical protein [Bacillus chungangensis]|uniref:Uncharacterized protein n=1 Tax=Bacillus chungangensis TaxID=587633 RepID=A0ABT9WY96_9BACI|nr:hypothetical protein [Bacillus chungangensis]MDQ0178266.1 hypothetical protein [Bacillus chungangensis]